ncbi:MAG: hypothetical protein U0270_39025 [Labilithrix sp.]
MSRDVLVPCAFGVIAVAACTPSPRDVVPESRDVREQQAPVAKGNPDTYEYVVKRPHGIIAIAESRGLARADARAVADELADRFEQCATTLEEQGLLVEGAARVIAEQEASWSAPAASLRVAPGGAVAQNALLCLVAPLRTGRLTPEKPNTRAGMAIEATWQPVRLRGVSEPPK